MTMMEILVSAAQESPAWPAVFKAGAAEAIVRAVLAELGEPTGAMMKAGQTAAMATGRYRLGEEWICLEAWQAMIEHILNEGNIVS